MTTSERERIAAVLRPFAEVYIKHNCQYPNIVKRHDAEMRIPVGYNALMKAAALLADLEREPVAVECQWTQEPVEIDGTYWLAHYGYAGSPTLQWRVWTEHLMNGEVERGVWRSLHPIQPPPPPAGGAPATAQGEKGVGDGVYRRL